MKWRVSVNGKRKSREQVSRNRISEQQQLQAQDETAAAEQSRTGEQTEHSEHPAQSQPIAQDQPQRKLAVITDIRQARSRIRTRRNGTPFRVLAHHRMQLHHSASPIRIGTAQLPLVQLVPQEGTPLTAGKYRHTVRLEPRARSRTQTRARARMLNTKTMYNHSGQVLVYARTLVQARIWLLAPIEARKQAVMQAQILTLVQASMQPQVPMQAQADKQRIQIGTPARPQPQRQQQMAAPLSVRQRPIVPGRRALIISSRKMRRSCPPIRVPPGEPGRQGAGASRCFLIA